MRTESPAGCYWAATCPAETASDPPALPEAVDVVIIGSGVTGLAGAFVLARAGLSVLVLDKAGIGSGASGRNAGIMVLGYKASPRALEREFGLDAAIAIYRMSLDAFAFVTSLIHAENLDCDYVEGGHLEAAAEAVHSREMEGTRGFFAKHLGHRVESVSRHDMTSYLQSSRYFGGSFDPAGRSLHPVKYVRGLARLARAAGALLVPHTPVRGLRRTGDSFAVELGVKTVRVGKIVLATNAYTDHILPWLRSRVVAVRSNMIATQEMQEDAASSLLRMQITVSDSKRFLRYFRRSPDGRRLLFGGRTRFSSSMDASDIGDLRASLLEIFPQMHGVGVEFAWSGSVGLTRDFLPHVGCHRGLYYVLGYNGGGVAMGSYLGARLAGHLLGGDLSDLPIVGLPFRPFPSINGWPWFLPAAHVYHKLLDLLDRAR